MQSILAGTMQLDVGFLVGRGVTTATLGRLTSATVKLNYTLNGEPVPLVKIHRKPRNGGIETARPTGLNGLIPP